jgi:hypothetical protein
VPAKVGIAFGQIVHADQRVGIVRSPVFGKQPARGFILLGGRLGLAQKPKRVTQRQS